MIHSISNDILTVEISEKGAELRSIKSKVDGCEYLWQGNAEYWEDRSPTIFPICSSVFEGKYTYGDKEYEMDFTASRSILFSAQKKQVKLKLPLLSCRQRKLKRYIRLILSCA